MNPDRAVSRRGLLYGVGATAFATMFTGACGAEGEDGGGAGATRAIDTDMGSVKVPEKPQRIVALDAYTALQSLDELGAPLVAAGAFDGELRTLVSEKTKKLPVTGITTDIDVEAIAKARPDLIVGWKQFGEEIYDKLTAVAPTVLVTAFDRKWRDSYRDCADAAGLAEKGDQKIAELDKRVAEVGKAVAKKWPDGVKVSVLRVSDPNLTEIRSYTSTAEHFVSATMLSDLKSVTVTADGKPGAKGETNVAFSPERMRELDADVILYYLGGGAESDADMAALEKALTGHPLWSSLKAVQAKRAHRVDGGTWFNGGDVESANLILDDLEKHLT